MDFHHYVDIPVRWGDMDAYGHVNNTVFFRYLESARFAYFEYILPEVKTAAPMVVLADMQCRFEHEIQYPATARVKTCVSRLGNSSLTMESEIWTGETRCATAKAVMVWFDETTRRPTHIPEAFAKKVHSLEGV